MKGSPSVTEVFGDALPAERRAFRTDVAEAKQRGNSMTTHTQSPLRPGDVLDGKYRVDQVLGIGGMGVVVAATRLGEGAHGQVAIKCLRSNHRHDGDLASRFRREGRVMFSLRNEHTVRTIDSGQLDSGLLYIVMELLEGTDLRALVGERTSISAEEAASYVSQACAALTEAHNLGIIHRDLKPANLYLTRRADGSALLKVFDFGIAKLMRPNVAADRTKLTAEGQLLGTPKYMAPEQFLHNAIDARTDLWSLGVILYYLVTGLTPFIGDDPIELIFNICTKAPRPLGALRPDLPAGFESVVMRCLEKRPEDRFQNAAELASALRAFTTAPAAAQQLRPGTRDPRGPCPDPARVPERNLRYYVDPSGCPSWTMTTVHWHQAAPRALA